MTEKDENPPEKATLEELTIHEYDGRQRRAASGYGLAPVYRPAGSDHAALKPLVVASRLAREALMKEYLACLARNMTWHGRALSHHVRCASDRGACHWAFAAFP